MSLRDKESIVGTTLPTYPEEVIEAVGNKGHPLFWGEVKEVEMYVALFADLNVDNILDLATGSGAAAMAAAILRIGYEGLAMNANHANWLNRIMDKAMFAIVMDGTDDETKKIKADVANIFSPQIEEAREFLISDAGFEEECDEEDDANDDKEVE